MPKVFPTAEHVFKTVSRLSRIGFERLSFACAHHVLKRTSFTIVSNNCWGAHVYRALGRPYTTPFVGLFIPPEDYLQLVPDVPSVVHANIAFIPSSRHRAVEEFRAERNANYPIGLLDGRIELHFMHYQSPEEALAKWRRRAERADWASKSVFIKFCDHDGATGKQIREFDNLTGLSRVCFAGSRLSRTIRVDHVNGCEKERVPDGGELATISGKYFSTVDWIASGGMGGMRPWWGNLL